MLVLTGGKGSGKTTLLMSLLAGGEAEVQGFLSLKEMSSGVVTGISLLILPGNRLVPVATTTPMETDMSTGRFYFYPGVFDRVNEGFRTITPGVPFVFDEFGPLELQHRGHYPVFRALAEASHPALVVVRSDLAREFAGLIGEASAHRTICLEDDGPDECGRQIAAFLKGAGLQRPA